MSNHYCFQESQHKEMERAWRIAKEISNLIVYCRSVAFNIDRLKQKGFVYNEMSSFPETKAEKLISQQEIKFFVKYHQVNTVCRRHNVQACLFYFILKFPT